VGRRAAGLIAAAAVVLVAGAVLATVLGAWRYHDLWCFYHGGEAALRGLDPYDGPTWSALTADASRGAGPRPVKSPCPGAFAYPYWNALVFAPLALVPYEVAAIAWGALLIAGVVGGAVMLARATGAPARLLLPLVLGSVASVQVFAYAQLTGVLFPLLALSVGAAGARRGVAIALTALKPQLAGLFAPAMVVRALLDGERRVVVGAAAALAGLLAVSLAIMPAWPFEWIRELTTHRLEMARPLPSAWSVAGLLFGAAQWGAVLIVALVAAVLILVRGRRVDTVAYAALAVSISLFSIPYVYSYDHLFLALAWASVLATAVTASVARRRLLLALTVLVAVLLPWTLFAASAALDSDTWNGVIPALTALLVAGSLSRRETMAS
jgi:hypothetical protein